jgi:putative membrane protein
MEYLSLVPYAVAGTLLAATLALLPALHVYNVAGIFILLTLRAQTLVGGNELAMMLVGMIVGYAMLNTISAIFLGAPDDSTVFMVLPGQKYLLLSRGYEAAVLSGIGGLGGAVILLALLPIAPTLVGSIRAIILPHLHWLLAVIIAYLLMSEFPKGGDHGKTKWARLGAAWRGLAAGILTFVLSGVLGIVLMFKSPVPVESAFQNLLPAFIGLFAVPWLAENILSGTRIPPQHIPASVDAPPGVIARGVLSGAIGGLFAAFFPVVTGGIGSYLAGQATAQRDDRVFIISQGASKFLYYVGAFWLLFLPTLHVTKGGLAGMLATIYVPQDIGLYYVASALIALCGVLSFFLLLVYARGAVWLVQKVDYRYLSIATLFLMAALVYGFTGLGGLAVMLVATPVGWLPVLWGSRRLNCLGVLLVPITLNLAGLGPSVAHALGIL